MSVREYRDARREFERVVKATAELEETLQDKIEVLKENINDAKLEVTSRASDVNTAARELDDVFMTKVDNEMIFRLAKSQKIQVIEITEE